MGEGGGKVGGNGGEDKPATLLTQLNVAGRTRRCGGDIDEKEREREREEVDLGECETDGAGVGFAGVEALGGEVGVVGGIGGTLTFDGYGIVVVVGVGGFAFGGTVEPVAGVDLHGGLIGVDGKGVGEAVATEGGYFAEGAVVVGYHPAVVVAFTDVEGFEVGADAFANGVFGEEVHRGTGYFCQGAEGHLSGICWEVVGGVEFHVVAEA